MGPRLRLGRAQRSRLVALALLLLAALGGDAAATPCGFRLCIGGEPYRFVGLNAYELATLWGTNMGCGSQVDDLDAFFAAMPPDSVVRVAAEQQQALHPETRTIDFTALDRVVQAAERSGQRLVLTLANNWSDCDDGTRKDRDWYAGGFRQVRNARGNSPLPFWDYVPLIVSRYAASPAVAFWEPVNEPEPSVCPAGFVEDDCAAPVVCPPDAPEVLRHFFDAVGQRIQQLDPTSLVMSGTIGDVGRCGSDGADYSYVHASPGIDVASVHDYTAGGGGRPEQLPDVLLTRLRQARALDKPLVVGEAGVQADAHSPACLGLQTRRDVLAAEMDEFFRAGGSGYLLWNWEPVPVEECDYSILPDDPLVALLQDYEL